METGNPMDGGTLQTLNIQLLISFILSFPFTMWYRQKYDDSNFLSNFDC